jgi:uncharacterized membrane protein
MHDLSKSGWDLAALGIFALAWVAYEPLLRFMARGRHVINADLIVIRRAWMREMVTRPNMRLLDSQLIGHALNAASFFASSNLILIAGAAGVLFGGEGAYRKIEDVPLLADGEPMLFGVKLALVAVTLARGLLSFIWAIRQLNYCAAVIGAAPREGPEAVLRAYAEAAAAVLTPALSASNAGVRGYYFALAASAWLFGPWAFMATTLGAVGLLAWRQAFSPAAHAMRRVRALIEDEPDGPLGAAAPTAPATGGPFPSA